MIDTPVRTAPNRAPSPDLEVWRCAGCRRIVAKVADLHGRIDIVCKCGTMNSRDIR